ncbi:MAG TPA: radical SAM protein [Spirochaetota bacterium]|nr:radical SAM protein [Spirochaetota bacterium]HPI87707.1 radical SAM protein [Spirochaetota bacterium]HPR48168.1 radical SAM protein [Spirochaetota bacterium]
MNALNDDKIKRHRKSSEKKKYKFSELIADPVVRERWEKVRKYFFLRESTYDMTNRCNIRCDGCYYYEGDKQFARENNDPEAWRRLMREEKERGITYVVLAGAEPSLVPGLCRVCYEEMPLGCIASNGFKKIPESVGYKIHVSVWGNDRTSEKVRKAKNLLLRQIENYSGDDRAVFVYTFTRLNIDEAPEVLEILAKNGCRATFNMFSSPVGYTGELRHTAESLQQTRNMMIRLLDEYPDAVLFSCYNAVAHTHRLGLHDLYSCPYPRMNPSTDLGLGRSFRQYRTDLTWDRSAACCVPDTDCPDCRHYAAGSAVVTARLYRHAVDPESFKGWLDYVDTYLAVWVTGYEKGKNLSNNIISPPDPE